jgi:PAS domain S-box-containing protein
VNPVTLPEATEIEAYLRPSRAKGERRLDLVRFALALVSSLAIGAWWLLYPSARPPSLPTVAVAAAVYVTFALALVLWPLRETDSRRRSYVATSLDIVVVSAILALFSAGEGSGPRVELVRALSPLVFTTFILMSTARHDPANCLYTGCASLAAYVVLHLVSGSPFGGEPVQGILSLVLLVAAALGGWIASREGLGLALRSARTEHALEQVELHLLRLFESTPEAVVLLDPESRVVRANTAFVKLFGYEQEELARRSVDDLIVPPERAAEAAGYTAQTIGGQAVQAETVRRRKDGTTVDVSVLGAPVFQQGRQVGIFGMYRDMGERRRRERLFEALNRAALGMLRATSEEEAFGAAAGELEAMKLASVLFRLDSGRQCLVLTQLRATERYRRAVEQALGRGLAGLEVPLQPAGRYARLLEAREPVYNADKARIVDALVPGSAPQARAEVARILGPFASVAVPLLREGTTFGLLVVLSRDLVPADLPAVGAFGHQLAAALAKIGLIGELEANLRELTATQARFAQSQKLEAVGRLAGGVAHDFNNLLTIINGYAELLTEAIPAGAPHRQEVEEILRAGRRAAELTAKLLAFSRKQVLRVELVDLNAVSAGMRNALLRLLGEDIRLELELAPDLPAVRVDPAQLEQAILNVALNARDAMPGGGTLAVRTLVVEPDAAMLAAHPEIRPDPYACIRVEDTGTGIPPDALPHVFEPFFTTKDPGRGTGLGLAMVYGFVKQSGGYVYAANRPEGGACVSVYLPVASGQAGPDGAPPEAPAARAPGGSECILLVEDEPSVLAYTRALLERSGYRVLALPSAEAALALDPARLGVVKLLITDVVMPGMNGKALADALSSRFATLKVLFVSGHAEEVFARLGMPPGEVPLLEKPYSGPELLRRVRELLDS